MGKLTSSEVLHVGKLAKLDLTQKEVKKFTAQLSQVVDFVGQLSEVNTKDVEPTSQTTGLTNVFREDRAETSKCLSLDEALSGAKETLNGLFKVRAILSERRDK